MATLKVYRKPERFNLPDRYTRMPLFDSFTNYTFCRSLPSDMPDYILHEIGVFYEVREEVVYPGETGLVNREYRYPVFNRYKIYSNTGEDIFYCIGPDIDQLHDSLSLFLGGRDIFSTTFDLTRLENAHARGRIEFMGQKFVKRNGTLRVSQRKIDGHPFTQHDPDFQAGRDITNECFEVSMFIDGERKSFFVYPDGVITRRGAVPIGVDGFRILKRAYDVLVAL